MEQAREQRQAEEPFTGAQMVLMQMAGLLLAPAAWALQMSVSYALVPYLCLAGAGTLPLHIVSGVAIVLAALGLLLAWRVWRRAGGGWQASGHVTSDRARFLAVSGLLLGVYVLVIMLMQGALSFAHDPCEGMR